MPSLQELVRANADVAAVVTNPDRPAGRKLELQAPPVKLAADRLDIDVVQPPKVRDDAFHEWLRAIAPDVCVVVAYGKILPPSLLEIPRRGFVNLHFSLLPKYRGAAPVQRALMDGVAETGVTIIELTEGMDEGPVLAKLAVEVAEEETAGDLGARLAADGASLLARTLPSYVAGVVEPVEQDHAAATYAPKIEPAETRIEWNEPARVVVNKIRGLSPSPGAWTTFRGARLRVLRASRAAGSGAPGEVLDPRALIVGAADGAVAVRDVQPAGKKVMPATDYARGVRAAAGERFE